MASRTYLEGEQPYARIDIRDHLGRLADPAALTLRILVNNTERQALAVDAMTQLGTGRYEVALALDTPGEWWLQWRSTSPTTVTEQSFTVTASRFD